jgi:hypothetical protein
MVIRFTSSNRQISCFRMQAPPTEIMSRLNILPQLNSQTSFTRDLWLTWRICCTQNNKGTRISMHTVFSQWTKLISLEMNSIKCCSNYLLFIKSWSAKMSTETLLLMWRTSFKCLTRSSGNSTKTFSTLTLKSMTTNWIIKSSWILYLSKMWQVTSKLKLVQSCILMNLFKDSRMETLLPRIKELQTFWEMTLKLSRMRSKLLPFKILSSLSMS